ncbi:TPA: hypothetical protein HA249_02815 [Candidatus Woesearchaeota archaeon]|nr:hypothetical protein [Candidatus Woesearchaeota archaeon]
MPHQQQMMRWSREMMILLKQGLLKLEFHIVQSQSAPSKNLKKMKTYLYQATERIPQ